MTERLREWIESLGLSDTAALVAQRGVLIVGVVLIALASHFVFKRIVLRLVRRIVSHSQTNWDDALLRSRTFDWLAHLAPGVVVHLLAPVALAEWPSAVNVVRQAAVVYMILAGMLAINALLDGAMNIYRQYDVSRRVHIRSFVQLIKLVLFIVAGILVLSLLVGRSPIVFFSGLGAMTAVLLLIFKDTILGLVAGVQLSANDMVRQGDWISMPKYNADGDVLDVTLTTVKVQNWDKTITTIPTYALISDAFTNWRGMTESGGRRIKRSVAIDMSTIRICDDEMIGRFRKFAYIEEYIERKQREVAEWNREHGLADDEYLINGRRLTNVGTFRAYVEQYLRNHPDTHKEMTLIVRQLAPNEHGLPIEIYVFSANQKWAAYEGIQADIFDHIIAVVPEFGLRVFQSPAGSDIAALARRRADAETANH